MKEILMKLNACQESIEWVKDKTIEQAVSDCIRGDWMLWLAAKVEIDFKKLTLAKGLCANTVRHLMKDERSIQAVDTTIAFGKGEASFEDLKLAAAAASDAASAASATAAASASAYAAYAAASAFATAATTSASDAAADAAATAATASASDAAADAAASAASDAAYASASAAAYAAAYAAYVAASAAYASASAASVKKGNRLNTANICRDVFAQELIDKIEQI